MNELDSRMRKELLRAFLVQHRTRLGFRQSEVADLLGVSPVSYALFETGSLARDVSFAFVQRVAETLRLDERDRNVLFRLASAAVGRSREQVERSARDGAIRFLRQIQHFTRKVGAASSFEEAAILAVEASQRILVPDCLSVYAPEDGKVAPSDYARGPRGRYWGRLSQQIGYEQHRALPSTRVAISENILMPEEAEGPTTRVTFQDAQAYESSGYAFECATDQWHEINRVRMRSCLVVGVRERGEYRGILSVCWAKPRELLPVELELFATIGAIVELTALGTGADEIPAERPHPPTAPPM